MERKLLIIDSSAFIEQLLMQGNHDKYDLKILEFIEKGYQCSITPIIIYEVMDRILDEVKKKDYSSICVTKNSGYKLESQAYSKFLSDFRFLLCKYTCTTKILYPKGENFSNLLYNCISIRLFNGSQDRINLAIAVSNLNSDDNIFITGDGPIYNQRNEIFNLSDSRLKIYHIKKGFS